MDERSGGELMPVILKTLEDQNVCMDLEENQNFGIISLHSCGDLTPNLLKIFSQNKNYLKFLATFGCCYHKMEESNENDYNFNFKNFPFSETLKNVFITKYSAFKLSKFSLRVGGQENL